MAEVYKKVWCPTNEVKSKLFTLSFGPFFVFFLNNFFIIIIIIIIALALEQKDSNIVLVSKGEPMRIIYRMRGLLGDATEEFIESLDSTTGM